MARDRRGATDRETLIRDLVEGAFNNPVRIVTFNIADGCCRDVTVNEDRPLFAFAGIGIKMHGGKRPGAGRPRGSKTKKQALLLAAAEAGELPVDFLLRIMRDATVDATVRMDAAKSVAPYLHPRLAATVIAKATEETQVVIFKTTYEDDAAGIPPVRYNPMKTIEH